MPMFTIKKATLADIEVIRTLAAQTFLATYQHILTPEQIDYMIDWMYSSESLRNQMEKEHHIYYIAYEEVSLRAMCPSSRRIRICSTCRRFTYSPTSRNTNSDGNCSSRP